MFILSCDVTRERSLLRHISLASFNGEHRMQHPEADIHDSLNDHESHSTSKCRRGFWDTLHSRPIKTPQLTRTFHLLAWDCNIPIDPDQTCKTLEHFSFTLICSWSARIPFELQRCLPEMVQAPRWTFEAPLSKPVFRVWQIKLAEIVRKPQG